MSDFWTKTAWEDTWQSPQRRFFVTVMVETVGHDIRVYPNSNNSKLKFEPFTVDTFYAEDDALRELQSFINRGERALSQALVENARDIAKKAEEAREQATELDRKAGKFVTLAEIVWDEKESP